MVHSGLRRRYGLRRPIALAAAAAVCLFGPSAAGAAAPIGASGVVYRSGSGYVLIVYSAKARFTEVNLVVTGGVKLAIIQAGPPCRVEGVGTIDCSPYTVPVGKPAAVFRFASTPRLTKKSVMFVTLEDPVAVRSALFKIAENDTPRPRDRVLVSYLEEQAKRSQ